MPEYSDSWMRDLGDNIQRGRETGTKVVNDVADTLFELKSVENLKLFKVGKPSGFRRDVDPEARIKWHMESKMNVIDLVPCSYMVPLTKAKEVVREGSEATSLVDTLTPQISYGQSVQEFQKICSSYGLESNYGGLRLYLTDQTTATDDFTNSYTDNFLNSIYNQIVDKTKTLREIGRSVSSNFDQAFRKYGRRGGEFAGEQIGRAVDWASEKSEFTEAQQNQFSDKLKVLGGAIGAAVAAGNRISLPKLWSDSNYNPNISAVVKLVSPYGHPDAITEFIIKPLMYLMIMSSPRTGDGISYGHTPKLTVKGYGMVHLPLAHISNINLRKGGADTSYNIYRQPLSVDVSLQFESLVTGFAVFADDSNALSKASEAKLEDTNKITLNLSRAEAGQRAFFPTLGTIIDSIRPVAINKLVTKHNIHSLPIAPSIQPVEGDIRSEVISRPPVVAGVTPSGNVDDMADTSLQNVANHSNETVNNEFNNINDFVAEVREAAGPITGPFQALESIGDKAEKTRDRLLGLKKIIV